MKILKKGSPLVFAAYVIIPILILWGLFLLGNHDYNTAGFAMVGYALIYILYLLILGAVWWHLYKNWKYFISCLVAIGIVILWWFFI